MTQTELRRNNTRHLIEEMKKGRKLAFYDHTEFHLTEMHTAFCYIHKMIDAGKIPGWRFCSEWRAQQRFDGTTIRYKVYWLEKCEN